MTNLPHVKTSNDVLALVTDMASFEQEHLRILILNTKNRLLRFPAPALPRTWRHSLESVTRTLAATVCGLCRWSVVSPPSARSGQTCCRESSQLFVAAMRHSVGTIGWRVTVSRGIRIKWLFRA